MKFLEVVVTFACFCLWQCNADGTCEEAESKLTADQKKSILDLHNKYRSEEGATNMYKMEWDDVLAKRAQALADQCYMHHALQDKCNGSGYYGQNLAIVAPISDISKIPVLKAVRIWFNEKQFYTHADGSCTAGKACGHYTQVVWGNSRKVGCGVAYCPEATVYGGKKWKSAGLMACDYDPQGNYAGQKPYEKGTACSGCSNVMSPAEYGYEYKCENNMCTPCHYSGTDPNCVCQLKDKCRNGGKVGKTSCSCSCTEDYGGVLCEKFTACKDTKEKSACDYWKSIGCCTMPEYKRLLFLYCKKTCDLC